MADHYAGIPEEALDSPWKDDDLARLALHIVSWEELAPFWGLTEVEEEVIKKDNSKYAAQRLAALRRWKAKSPETATYRQLVRVFGRMGRMELIEKVKEIVLNPEEVPIGEPEDVITSYRAFLKKSYNQLPHPSLLTDQWPVMNSPTYIPLPLSKQPKSKQTPKEHMPTHISHFPADMRRFHKTNQPVSDKQDVHLNQLFSKCNDSSTKRVVIKGFPGSGKTTLTWHANQQWAKGELFQQFSLFLSIPLRSTRVQQATCLADLIPHPDREQRKTIAQAISARNGEDVFFWFDGWDEMPQEVQRDSFIASFIRQDSPGSSLPECFTVVTTRPESSLKISEEFWMNGLSVDQLNKLITKRVEGTDHNASKLITCLEKNTSLQAFCFVPLNVAIMVSLFFLFRSGLPNTQTELFECLVLNLLLRNLQMRWKLGITSLKTFAALPDLPSRSFRTICEIAFQGIMNAKTVFSRSDVPNLQMQQALHLSTLGLMEISPRMEWYGVEEELTFLHTTLQEFLAAVHLNTLGNEGQMRIVMDVLESDSLQQKSVLQFYAGLTKLSSSKVFTTILQRCAITNLLGRFNSSDYEELSSFMTFVNCVYEAQSGHLCQELVHHHHLCLSFDFTHFNTSDLSNLGYFIGWFCQKKTCKLTLDTTYITPQQIKVFVNQVKQVWNGEHRYHRPSLSLIVSDSFPHDVTIKFQNERIPALCELIKDTNLVSQFHLKLFFSYIVSPLLIHYSSAMKNLVEAFARDSSCSDFTLQCDIIFLRKSNFTKRMLTAYSEYYAVLLITFCKHIKKVAFHRFFEYHYSYPLFASALQYNTNIQVLDLSRNVAICEETVANIARALRFNESIRLVDFGDQISAKELATFLYNYGFPLPVMALETVVVSEQAIPGEKERQIIKMINLARISSGHNNMFKVARYIDVDDDYDAHYVVYNGFNTRIVDLDDDTFKEITRSVGVDVYDWSGTPSNLQWIFALCGIDRT